MSDLKSLVVELKTQWESEDRTAVGHFETLEEAALLLPEGKILEDIKILLQGINVRKYCMQGLDAVLAQADKVEPDPGNAVSTE